MPDRSAPETSTVREALTIVEAADRIADHEISGATFVESIEEMLDAARRLRPHQVGDVVAYLRARHGQRPESTRPDDPTL